MLDERVRAVLARMEAAEAHPPAVPVARETGRFLFAFVAPQWDCEVLEIGAGRGYSTLWLGAGVRYLGGRVRSVEKDAAAANEWRRNIAEAELDQWTELIEGDARDVVAAIDDVFDVVFLDAAKSEYERYFELIRDKLEPGAVVIADNVISHAAELGAYVTARQADPTLVSVTVPLDRGLELSAVLTDSV